MSLIIADDSYLLGADDSPGVANHSALASAETERLDHEIGEYTVDFLFYAIFTKCRGPSAAAEICCNEADMSYRTRSY